MKRLFTLAAAAVLLTVCLCAQAAEKDTVRYTMKTLKSIEYARPDGHVQLLDLYLPEGAKSPTPLIIFIHGGGWEAGDRNCFPDGDPISRGYAVASIDYRLSQVAKFPAQIVDCKAAARWLRAHAGEYNLDPARFAAWGYSAGGHLSALLGTSGRIKNLDGPDPANAEFASSVQAVVDCCGPTDFTRMGTFIPDIIERFLGGPVSKKRGLAISASPVTYVTKDDPPFLIVHGKLDDLVPWQQAQELHDKLVKAGVASELRLIPDAGHGFGGPELNEAYYAFLDKHLKQ